MPEPDIFIPRHESILKAVATGNPKAARRAAQILLEDTDHTIAGFSKSQQGEKARKT